MSYKSRLYNLLQLLPITILGLILVIGIFSFILVLTNPLNTVVQYYDRIMTQQQLEAEIGNLTCAAIPLSEVSRLFRLLSSQPLFMCFDSLHEANDWLISFNYPH
jgi:hypothetical protein